MRLLALSAAVLFSAAPVAAADPRPEPVVLEGDVAAPPAEVWRALTSPRGVRSFFAAQAKVEPMIGGAYEIYFIPTNPPGLRGTENVRILAMEPPRRLLISWNAPTAFGDLRTQQTTVEFELAPAARGTRLTLTHFGWGRGARWQKVRDYFAGAWPYVLGQLQYRFDHGPIDWKRPPDGAAYFKPAS
jgi:uncharacterized protein YndB with AHSA1/START domain